LTIRWRAGLGVRCREAEKNDCKIKQPPHRALLTQKSWPTKIEEKTPD